MKIVRIEEGHYSRRFTLEIDEALVSVINKELEDSIVNGATFKPLTVEEVWTIMTKSIEAPRFKEEYFIDIKFYNGIMKLGDFVRLIINTTFEELPGELDDEIVEFYRDEFYT